MSDIMSTPPQPVNYTGMQIPADPVGNFLKAAQAQATIGLTGAQTQYTQNQADLAQLAAQRQQQYQQQYQTFLQNPTPQAAVKMAMANPEYSATVQSAWNGFNEQQRQQKLDTFSPIYSSLLNGRYDLADNLMQNHIDAIQNTPGYQDNPQLMQDLQVSKQFHSLVQGDQQNGTNHATAFMGSTLAAAMGPQDFQKNFVGSQTTPAAVETANVAPRQANATVGQTNAVTQDLQSIVARRAADFQLDQNKFLADVQFKIADNAYNRNAPNMAPQTRMQADQDAASSVAYSQAAERMGTLAQNIGVLDQQGKWAAGKPEDIRAGWQNFWGTQDNVNTMRNEYQAVMGSLGAFGGAGLSKDDAKNLQPGIPAKNADPAQIQSFLQSFQNAELRAARMSDAKSSWAYAYGRLGPATQDANIGGIQVAKGTTFPQFMNQLLKAGSTAPSAFAAPNAPPGVQINQPGQPPAQGGAFTGNLSYLNRYTGGGQ